MLDKDYVALKPDYKPDSILDIVNNRHHSNKYPFGKIYL